MAVTVQCNVHPKYKAIRRPNGDCDQCWAIWGLVYDLKLYKEI